MKSMRIRQYKNGTVSITGMDEHVYTAIQEILFSSKQTFEYDEEESEYRSNDDFVCSLSEEQKDALDNIAWFI